MTRARDSRACRARRCRPVRSRRARRPRPGHATGLALLVVLLALAAGETTAARADDMATRDWTYALYAVSDLATHPVDVPLVLLMGGSATRECTVSDRSWRDEIVRRGGPPTVTRTLASRNQTFAQDLHLVRLLPSTPAVVIIGVNAGRFFADPATRFRLEPLPCRRPAQHRYSVVRVLPPQGKARVAAQWMGRRYRPFSERLPGNLAALEQLVATCVAKGLHPVLLDMPRNTEVIGDRLDLPVAEYSRACAALAARHHVPFVSFVTGAGLTSDDFFDIAHLVEPGRAKWQARLSALVVDLLREYGMACADGTPSAHAPDLHDWCVSPLTGLAVFAPQEPRPEAVAAIPDDGAARPEDVAATAGADVGGDRATR